MKGWGPKSSVCPSKPGKPNFFGRISRVFFFCWDIPGVPKKFEKKKFVFDFGPLEKGKIRGERFRLPDFAFCCGKRKQAHPKANPQNIGREGKNE